VGSEMCIRDRHIHVYLTWYISILKETRETEKQRERRGLLRRQEWWWYYKSTANRAVHAVLSLTQSCPGGQKWGDARWNPTYQCIVCVLSVIVVVVR